MVNSVHWNPTDTFIVASSSDDHTVRIWGLEDMPLADLVQDSKEIRRIDGVNPIPNGKEVIEQNFEEEEDDDDDEEYLEDD